MSSESDNLRKRMRAALGSHKQVWCRGAPAVPCASLPEGTPLANFLTIVETRLSERPLLGNWMAVIPEAAEVTGASELDATTAGDITNASELVMMGIAWRSTTSKTRSRGPRFRTCNGGTRECTFPDRTG